MTQVQLNPNSLISNSGAATGTLPGLLSDSDDGSYVQLNSGESTVVGVADLTLPAGAVVRWALGVVRVSKLIFSPPTTAVMFLNCNGKEAVWSQGINSDNATTLFAASLGQPPAPNVAELSDADIDALTLTLGNWGPHDLVIYESWAVASYWVIPVTTVENQGTFTDDDTPTLEFIGTFDDQAIDPYYFEAKIFNVATYGGGGFDPETSTPSSESGIQILGQGRGVDPDPDNVAGDWTSNVLLPDGTYRLYVKVADVPWPTADSDEYQWSAWDFGDFVIAVDRPSIPVLLAASDDANARVTLTATKGAGGAVSADFAEFERSEDGGTTWLPVRTDSEDSRVPYSGTTAVAYDYDGGNGVDIFYRARSVHEFASGTFSRSAWSNAGARSWSSNDWWFKHPYDSSLNFKPRIRSQPERNQAANKTEHKVLGRRLPVAISDVRGGFTGEVVIRSDTDAEREQLLAILADNSPLLLQAPPSSYAWDDTWMACGDLAQVRTVDSDIMQWTFDRFTWTEIDRPS